MLSPALHRQPDPDHSQDPRIRALVGQLRGVDLPGPRPEFRDELRTQLVAITPRVVAESSGSTENASPVRTKRRPSPVPAAAPGPRTRGRVRTGLSRLGHVHVGRPLAVLTCIVAVFAVLLGGAVWISKRALPGDALYGLKRASENVQEAMTSGDSARAKLLLDFASNRYDEVADLLPSSGGAVSDHTGSLVSSTLDSADGDVKQAMQSLGVQAIRNHNGAGLGLVTGWAGAPLRQLHDLVARIPAGTLHQRGADSLTLLNAAAHRAALLKALGNCGCLAHARTDDLGAVPCKKCGSAAGPAVAPPTVRTSSNGPAGTQQRKASITSGRAAAHSVGSAHTAASAGASSPGAAASTVGGTSSDALHLPVGPGLPSLTNPLASGSCAGLDLGLLSVGPCGVGLASN